jgi:hypothetical protein
MAPLVHRLPIGISAIVLLLAVTAGAAGSSTSVFSSAPTGSVQPLVAYHSASWAGYVLVASTNHAFTEVKGSWIQPKMAKQCAPSGTSAGMAMGVGLDGATSTTTTFEFVGIEVLCHGSQTPVIKAIVSLSPSTLVYLNISVHPGNVIAAGILLTSTGHLKMWVSNQNLSKTVSYYASKTYTSATARDSAEWIMAALYGYTYLAHFQPFECGKNFTGIHGSDYANKSGHFRSIGSFSGHTQIWNYYPATTLRATASSLVDHGSSFTVKWKHF